ncbi:hypothetical protein [Sandaracinobacteroides sp. A072]
MNAAMSTKRSFLMAVSIGFVAGFALVMVTGATPAAIAMAVGL